jgi:hypothetical protein
MAISEYGNRLVMALVSRVAIFDGARTAFDGGSVRPPSQSFP